jgi:hypothetical protein
MFKTVLIFVLIFAASTAFAGSDYVQDDKSTKTVLCTIDSQPVFNQDFDDFEFDVAPSSYIVCLSPRVTDAPKQGDISLIASSNSRATIRAPPHRNH